MKVKQALFLDEKEAFEIYLLIRIVDLFNFGKWKRNFKLNEAKKKLFYNLMPSLNDYSNLKIEKIKEYEFLNHLLKKSLEEIFNFSFSSDVVFGEEGEKLEILLEKVENKIYFKEEVKEFIEKISYKEEFKNLLSLILYVGLKLSEDKKSLSKVLEKFKNKKEIKNANLNALNLFKELLLGKIKEKAKNSEFEINLLLLDYYLDELNEKLNFPFKVNLDLQAYYLKEKAEGFVSFKEVMEISNQK